MKFKIFLALGGLLTFAYFAYGFINKNDEGALAKDSFSKLWYDGNAEINSYTLSQNRYGETHDGSAVLIFVTEDFSKRKQVKLDNPDEAGSDRQPVLKLNFTKSFLTGIYPYTIMNSVFSPIDLSGAVKSTCSVQEWCGHTFTQINKTKIGFDSKEFSYFESEGDDTKSLPSGILEDELWNMIRINPSKIPLGRVQLLRGNIAVRLMHRPLEYVVAEIFRGKATIEQNNFTTLNIVFPERKLVIYYDDKFPHTIHGWDETYGEFGNTATVTSARLKKSIRLPYWKLHNKEHLIYRDSLGI